MSPLPGRFQLYWNAGSVRNLHSSQFNITQTIREDKKENDSPKHQKVYPAQH
jgi:hypothetical protein